MVSNLRTNLDKNIEEVTAKMRTTLLLILIFGLPFLASASYQYRPVSSLIESYQLQLDESEKQEFLSLMEEFRSKINSDASQISDLLARIIADSTQQGELLNVYTYMYVKSLTALSLFDSASHMMGTLLSKDLSLILKIDCLILQGRILKIQGFFSESLLAFTEAHRLLSNMNDPTGSAILFVNLGEYYRAIGEYELAAENLQKAQKILDTLQRNIPLEMYLYSRKSAVFNETDMVDSALRSSQYYLHLAEKNNNSVLKAEAYNELASTYSKLGHDEKVEEMLEQAIALWQEAGYDRYWVNAAGNLVSFWVYRGEWEKARPLMDQVLPVVRERQWYSVLYTFYEHEAFYHLYYGDIDKAHLYLDSARETVFQDRKTFLNKEVEVIKARFAVDQKQQELEAQKQQAKQESTKVKLMLWAFSATVLLLIVLGWFGMKVSRKNKYIEDINNQLNDAVNVKETLLKDLHHRIKNNLTFLIGLIQLQKSQTTSQEVKDELGQVKSRLESMALLHSSILSRNNSDDVPLHLLFGQIKNQFETLFTSFSLEIHAETKPLFLPSDKALLLGVILNELITNSIKHSSIKNGLVLHLHCLSNPSTLRFRLVHEPLRKNVAIDFQNPVGVGTKLIKLLVSQLKGEVEYLKETDEITLNISQPVL